MLEATFWGGFAAASLILGYFLSARQLSRRAVELIMGFGGGALLSAIAYELVPEPTMTTSGADLRTWRGGIFRRRLVTDRQGGADHKDIAGDKAGGSGAAIFIGTLLDNVLKSIILGIGLL